jgi:hypothetical protein
VARSFVRTYVRMAPPPYRPLREFEHAVERRDLAMAVAIARDVASDTGRPIGLDFALQLLPLAAARRELYDAWALRWLARWLGESQGGTIEQAADVAAALADLPIEPLEAVAAVRQASAPPGASPERRSSRGLMAPRSRPRA